MAVRVDSLIGLIPNVGDTLTSFASFYILLAGVRYGVPKITLLRMAFNIGLDYVVGMVPFVGDAFDFVWKANQQNMNLIRTRRRSRKGHHERLRFRPRPDRPAYRAADRFDHRKRDHSLVDLHQHSARLIDVIFLRFPIRRTRTAGLQTLEYAERFIDRASDIDRVNHCILQYALRIDDEQTAERDVRFVN